MVKSKSEFFEAETQLKAKFCRALSHPARISILLYLSKINICMSGDITEELPLSRSTVSQHLTELKEAGLIKGQIQGNRTNYCLNPSGIKRMKEELGALFEEIDKDFIANEENYFGCSRRPNT